MSESREMYQNSNYLKTSTDSLLREIYAFPFDATEFPLNLEAVGKSENSSKEIAAHFPCRNFIVEYIVKGKGVLIYDDKTYYPKAGDLYILHRGVNCKYYPEKNTSWQKYWINIDGVAVENLLISYDLYDTILFTDINCEDIFMQMYKTAAESVSPEAAVDEISVLFFKLILLLYRKLKYSPNEFNANAIKRMLDSNIYSNNFSLNTIADELHISTSQVISTFKDSYDFTPHQYLQNKKIKMAVSMLLNTNKSIKEIACTLQFSDQYYFSKVFKHATGKSPLEFRLENRLVYRELNNWNIKKPLSKK